MAMSCRLKKKDLVSFRLISEAIGLLLKLVAYIIDSNRMKRVCPFGGQGLNQLANTFLGLFDFFMYFLARHVIRFLIS